VILRNALFTVGGPRSLALFGELDEGATTTGTLALTHDIHRYLPTLPDPYVATYTPYLRDPAALGAGRLQQALTGFVKWPDPAPLPDDADERVNPRAFVYYRLTPPLPPRPVSPSRTRTFRAGVATFDRDLAARIAGETTIPRAAAPPRDSATATPRQSVDHYLVEAVRSGALTAAVSDLERHPLLAHLRNRSDQITRSLEANVAAAQRRDATGAGLASSAALMSPRLESQSFSAACDRASI
jgi:hypothetical protein